MSTVTITNVPKEVVERRGEEISYPTLQWDGMDRLYDGEVLTKKQDSISRLQAKIDFLRGEVIDADDYFASKK